MQKAKKTNYEKHLIKCPHCGADVLDHFKECPVCHEKLTPAGYKGGRMPASTRKKIRTALLVISIAVLLVMAFVLPNI